MKVTTPQISLHVGELDGKNAPILCTSIIQSGANANSYVLATGGSNKQIQLWRFQGLSGGQSSVTQGSSVKLEHLIALTRAERSVNALKFSPNGLYLVAAGDGGNVIVWSVPQSRRGGGNGRHFWAEIVTKESDLLCRIVSSQCEDIFDVSWSANSKRFVVGSLDHSVIIFDHVEETSSSSIDLAERWMVTSRSKEHSHYVQGVAYDPLGTYIASQASDRTVRVMKGKYPKEKNSGGTSINIGETHRQVLDEFKLGFDGKGKVIKHFTQQVRNTISPNTRAEIRVEHSNDDINIIESQEEGNERAVRRHLFADESVESFFRRLDWTPDGSFLVVPSGLWPRVSPSASSELSFSTFLFARHKYDHPVVVFSGHGKASVAVRACPKLFSLPRSAETENFEKENCSISSKLNDERGSLKSNLPYRTIFAVLTIDSVLIYDTIQVKPLAIVKGLHYASLTDATWTDDGLNLIVTSSDGYLSVLSFEEGELGYFYEPEPSVCTGNIQSQDDATIEDVSLPPCTPGESVAVEIPSTKRVKMASSPVSSVVLIDKDAPPIGMSCVFQDVLFINLTQFLSYFMPETISAKKIYGKSFGIKRALTGKTKFIDQKSSPDREVAKNVNNLTLQKSKKKRIQPMFVKNI